MFIENKVANRKLIQCQNSVSFQLTLFLFSGSNYSSDDDLLPFCPTLKKISAIVPKRIMKTCYVMYTDYFVLRIMVYFL